VSEYLNVVYNGEPRHAKMFRSNNEKAIVDYIRKRADRTIYEVCDDRDEMRVPAVKFIADWEEKNDPNSYTDASENPSGNFLRVVSKSNRSSVHAEGGLQSILSWLNGDEGLNDYEVTDSKWPGKFFNAREFLEKYKPLMKLWAETGQDVAVSLDEEEKAHARVLEAIKEDMRKKAIPMTTGTHDPVNHPSHYTQYKGIEIIELTEQMNFNLGNAVKYACRAGYKSKETEIQDLEKAIWYLRREIERLKKYSDE